MRAVAAAAGGSTPSTSSNGGLQADTAAPEGSSVCSQRAAIHDVPGSVAEEVADVLLAYGAQTASIEEHRPEGAPEQEIYQDTGAAEPARVWDRCNVVAHLPPDIDAAGLLGSVAADFGLQHLQTSVALVHMQAHPGGSCRWRVLVHTQDGRRMQDWQQSIKDSFVPSRVCEGLWIVPSWSERPQTGQGAVTILLEPGLAFGTGDHPTTRLCLRWLHRLSQQGRLQGASLLDWGTGSGVLAVGALLLGAESAVGTDIDPLAVRAARQNAELNGVAGKLTAAACSPSGELLPEGAGEAAVAAALQQRQYDVTVANILQGPLISLAPLLAAATKPGGLLGLSGILQEQAEGVKEGYSPWFEDFAVEGEDRWALVTARRKSDC